MDLCYLIPEKYITDCLQNKLTIANPIKKFFARREFLSKAESLCKKFMKHDMSLFEGDLEILKKEIFQPKNYDLEVINYGITPLNNKEIINELDSTFFRSIYKEYKVVHYIIASRFLINLDKKTISEIYKRFRIFEDIDEHFTIICNCKNLVDYKNKIESDGEVFVKAVDAYYRAIA